MHTDIPDPKFTVVRIRGASYRKLIVPEDLRFKCDDEPRAYDDEDDEVYDDQGFDMVYEGNMWVYKMPVAAIFHRFIVGSRGKNKQKIEMDSGCEIQVPSKEDTEDAIWLRARSKQSIFSAKAQIELLCEKEEEHLEYTHFLSVPLAMDDRFRKKTEEFKENVVLKQFDGIDASIFMNSRRMHFTICMLKLHSHAQVEEMKKALDEFSKRISGMAIFGQPLKANMKGLHIMTDDTSNVGVVFTTDRSSALQNRMNNMADSLFAVIKSHGLISDQNLMKQRALASDGKTAEVKLHATLINTKYGRDRWREDGARGDRDNFDASLLLETFGQIDFGSVPMKELQLSCLDEMGNAGYYRSLYSLPLCSP